MSDSIMSVSQIIEAALPDETTKCTINFRLLKTLIVIIANQLRVLNRHVLVNEKDGMKYPQTPSRASLVVSEVKIQAEDENNDGSKKRKKRDQKRKDVDRKKEDQIRKVGERKKEERKWEQIDGNKEKQTKTQGERQKERDVYQRTSKGMVQCNSDVSLKSGGAEEEAPIIKEAVSLHQTLEDDLAELREREIRIISQRADSHEDPALSPSPMASVHSLGKENLLIGRPPKINIVTKDKFDALADAVHELQAHFDPIGIPGFPENAEFLKALRRGASLTEAMAALQMSARLQAFEKAFVIMISLLTELAKKTPGVDVAQFNDLETNFTRGLLNENTILRPEHVKDSNGTNDWVSREEFNNAMHELYDEVLAMLKKRCKSPDTDSKNAEAIISRLERKLEAHNYEERIKNLEAEIIEYTEKFETLDTNLASQIGGYQEELMQMQYQLETGIENITDKVALIRSDPEALGQLNERLDALQHEMENAAHEQNNLRGFQNNMALDLAKLWKEIELIRDAKADREEVNDALRDKAGIENLNGMLRVDQFDASRAELETRIKYAYNMFKDQELVWQSALDDFTKALNEKSDWIQVCALRDDINRHLNKLQEKIDCLVEVVGEPRAAAVRKEVFRDADCVCCGNPANMNMEVPVPSLPSFKRASANNANATRPGEDGDHGVCIPGRLIPRNSKNHICQRFCGGSHTLMPHLSRAPPGVTITRLPRTVTTTVGNDGKTYLTEEHTEIKPCGQCNIPKASPQPKSKDEAVPESADAGKNSSVDTVGDMSWLKMPKYDSEADYPALPSFDDGY